MCDVRSIQHASNSRMLPKIGLQQLNCNNDHVKIFEDIFFNRSKKKNRIRHNTEKAFSKYKNWIGEIQDSRCWNFWLKFDKKWANFCLEALPYLWRFKACRFRFYQKRQSHGLWTFSKRKQTWILSNLIDIDRVYLQWYGKHISNFVIFACNHIDNYSIYHLL